MNSKKLFLFSIYPLINIIVLFIVIENIVFSLILNILVFIISILFLVYENKKLVKYKSEWFTNRFISLFINEYKENNDIKNCIETIKEKLENNVKEIIQSQIIEDGELFLNSLATYYINDRYKLFLNNIKDINKLINIKTICEYENETFDKILNKKALNNFKNILYWIVPLLMLLVGKLIFMTSFNNLFLTNEFNVYLIAINTLYILNIFYITFEHNFKGVIKLIVNSVIFISLLVGLIISLVNLHIFFIILFVTLTIFISVLYKINILDKKEIIKNTENYIKKRDNLINNSLSIDNEKFKANLINITNIEPTEIRCQSNYLLLPLIGGAAMIIVICILIMDMIGGTYNAL